MRVVVATTGFVGMVSPSTYACTLSSRVVVAMVGNLGGTREVSFLNFILRLLVEQILEVVEKAWRKKLENFSPYWAKSPSMVMHSLGAKPPGT